MHWLLMFAAQFISYWGASTAGSVITGIVIGGTQQEAVAIAVLVNVVILAGFTILTVFGSRILKRRAGNDGTGRLDRVSNFSSNPAVLFLGTAIFAGVAPPYVTALFIVRGVFWNRVATLIVFLGYRLLVSIVVALTGHGLLDLIGDTSITIDVLVAIIVVIVAKQWMRKRSKQSKKEVN